MAILSIKQVTAVSLIVLALMMVTGCASAGGQSAGSSAASAAQMESSAAGAAIETNGDMTVYDCGGIQIGIPTEYLDQLIVTTDFAPSNSAEEGTCLIAVNEKASVEAAKADFGEDIMGFLFRIEKLSQAGYEHYVCGGREGCDAFAKDGENYYICTTATDVQFYRSGGEIDTTSQEWKNWETLFDMGSTVRADMIARNGLTAYSDDQFFNKEFTYGGGHAYMKYCPYFTFDGTKREYQTLVLSQPVRQGEGGIWCVERFYDVYGYVYSYFPSTDIIGSDDVTAEEYYNRLQKECDAGSRSDILTPLGAAKWFVTNSGEYNDTPVDNSFETMNAPDTAYMNTNQQITSYVSTLHAGGKVNAENLLSCAGGFTSDNWGVLGRFNYGSDWWSPLQTALKNAAVGADQDLRDRDMIHLYLSYSKSDGPIAEGLTEILLIQHKADADVFDQVLTGFSDVEQESIRGVLESVRS